MLQPKCPDRRPPAIAFRYAGQGDQPRQSAIGRRAYQRSRAAHAWPIDRCLSRSSRTTGYAAQRHCARSRSGPRLRTLGILQLSALPAPALIQMFGGFLLLLIGAELSVRAAVHLAAIFKVRPLIIGLTVVAMGTSAPQMAVSLQAAFSDNTDIAVGSVIGGNIFNVLVILGLCALIIPLRVARQVLHIDIPLMIGACLLAIGLSWNGEFSTFDGVVLLAGLLVCLFIIVRQGGHGPRHGQADITDKPRTLTRMLMLAAGLLMLTAGGHLLVNASVVIALHLGLSERIIGLTVIAIGTSLPALMASLIAALRGERDIA
ncbi:K+-dependent Na+/Ca+ exchanger related-protein, partial [Pseudomonas syringae pv. philadelphi]